MSGVVKKIGKAFKGVVKVVKKIAPIALAIGAVVFTAGAALGALPAWGAAVSSVFGTSTLGSIAAGAITQAGYGAAIGAATAAVTGKSIKRGLAMGALTGAITGGITGAVSPANIDPIGKWVTGNSGQAASTAITSTPLDAPATQALSTPTVGTEGISSAVTPAAVRPVVEETARGLSNSGFWSGPGAQIAGSAIGGIGQGIGQANAARTEQQMQQQQQAAVASNYALPATGSTGLVNQSSARAVANPTAPPPTSQPAGDQASSVRKRWKYNAELGDFELVPA